MRDDTILLVIIAGAFCIFCILWLPRVFSSVRSIDRSLLNASKLVREILGILISPFVWIPICFFPWLLFNEDKRYAAVMYFIASFYISCVSAIVIGIPTVFVLKKFRRTKLLHFIFAGVFLGIVSSSFVFKNEIYRDGGISSFLWFLSLCIPGAVISFASFWFIAIRKLDGQLLAAKQEMRVSNENVQNYNIASLWSRVLPGIRVFTKVFSKAFSIFFTIWVVVIVHGLLCMSLALPILTDAYKGEHRTSATNKLLTDVLLFPSHSLQWLFSFGASGAGEIFLCGVIYGLIYVLFRSSFTSIVRLYRSQGQR